MRHGWSCLGIWFTGRWTRPGPLGFEPAADFTAAAGHLGPWDEHSAITFGRDGIPYYVAGPHDYPAAVLDTLNRTVGVGNLPLHDRRRCPRDGFEASCLASERLASL